MATATRSEVETLARSGPRTARVSDLDLLLKRAFDGTLAGTGLPWKSAVHYARKESVFVVGLDRKLVGAATAGCIGRMKTRDGNREFHSE